MMGERGRLSEETWNLLHHLWTRDVGREGYVKREWQALEKALLDLSRTSTYGSCEGCRTLERSFEKALEGLSRMRDKYDAKEAELEGAKARLLKFELEADLFSEMNPLKGTGGP